MQRRWGEVVHGDVQCTRTMRVIGASGVRVTGGVGAHLVLATVKV